MIKRYKHQRDRRHQKIRAKIVGTSGVPRVSVFRSNKYIYAQIIDDNKGATLLQTLDKVSKKSPEKLNKIQSAKLAGKLLAQEAIKKNIKKVVFDRGGYKYHGRVKALAESARQEGLEF